MVLNNRIYIEHEETMQAIWACAVNARQAIDMTSATSECSEAVGTMDMTIVERRCVLREGREDDQDDGFHMSLLACICSSGC